MRSRPAAQDPLLGVEELSAELGVPATTIYKWNERKTGPRGFRVGKYVKYRRSEVNRWLAERGDTAQVRSA